jgi:3-oxoacyl-[acyl-carrier protein] reductase
MQDITNHVVVVTGASRGIGAALAKAFADQHCRLLLTARKKPDLDKTAKALKLPLDHLATVAADISSASGMKKLVAAAFKKYGRIDLFINNAGVGIEKNIIAMTEREYDQIFDTNLKAVFLSFRELIPRLKKQGGGHILNISSMAGKQGHAGIAAYAASKAALNSLCEGVGAEVRNDNIKISVLAPGSTDTAFRHGMTGRPKGKMPSNAAKRKLVAPEVAEAAVFLARQNANSWVSMTEMRPLITGK